MNALVPCPHCARPVHVDAPSCPQCGAARGSNNTYATYDQVPWYRKRWFAILSVVVFMPAFLIIAFTGDVYFLKNQEMKTMPKRSKWIVLTLFIAMMLIRLGNA